MNPKTRVLNLLKCLYNLISKALDWEQQAYMWEAFYLLLGIVAFLATLIGLFLLMIIVATLQESQILSDEKPKDSRNSIGSMSKRAYICYILKKQTKVCYFQYPPDMKEPSLLQVLGMVAAGKQRPQTTLGVDSVVIVSVPEPQQAYKFEKSELPKTPYLYGVGASESQNACISQSDLLELYFKKHRDSILDFSKAKKPITFRFLPNK